MVYKLLALWLLAASAVAAGLTWWDKRCAGRGRRRVPEKTLFLWAALGGSAAMYATMRLIRHKTLHRRFMWGLPALLLLQCAAACGLWRLFAG